MSRGGYDDGVAGRAVRAAAIFGGINGGVKAAVAAFSRMFGRPVVEAVARFGEEKRGGKARRAPFSDGMAVLTGLVVADGEGLEEAVGCEAFERVVGVVKKVLGEPGEIEAEEFVQKSEAKVNPGKAFGGENNARNQGVTKRAAEFVVAVLNFPRAREAVCRESSSLVNALVALLFGQSLCVAAEMGFDTLREDMDCAFDDEDTASWTKFVDDVFLAGGCGFALVKALGQTQKLQR